jgi:V/A-type H+-transporting ATPase subunit K
MKAGHKTATAILFVVAVAIAIVAVWTIGVMPAGAQTHAGAAAVGVDPELRRWAFISAALAAGLSTLAAGYAVAVVGSAAVGALAEKPELLGRVLILVGLAEGIAIYGLIVAILILNRA